MPAATPEPPEISVSEFRKKCLTLMDNLPSDGILITRHGDQMGSVPGMVIDPGDDLLTTGIKWDAES